MWNSPPPPHAFVFADLVGFTALTAAHGDERGAEIGTRFHTAVNVASRLCDTADAGEVLVSEDAAAAVPAHPAPVPPAAPVPASRGLVRLRAALLALMPCLAGDRIQGAH